jgi:hypothetical protein
MRTFLFVFSLLAAGCATYEPHVWTRPETLSASAMPIPVEKLSGINDTELEPATALLENTEYVELSATEATRLAKITPEAAPGERMFLLRGLSWDNHPPHFRKVYVEHSTKAVYVVGYSWNGEILIPFRKRSSVASPVIASLAFVPNTVIPKAVLGGDAVFAHARGALHESNK